MKRKKSGFTLLETLVAVLIMVLLTGAVAAGMTAASSLYTKSMLSSESELLSATIDSALGDVLHYAEYQKTDPDGTVVFTNKEYGVASGHLLLSNGKIYLNTKDIADDAENAKLLMLLGDGTYSSLKIQNFALQYANGVFSGRYTIAGKNGKSVKEINFTYSSVNG